MNLALRFGAFLLASILAAGIAQAQQSCPDGYPSTTPDSDFADAGNGTVRHNPTGLIWKRCAEGQSWNSSTCTGTAGSYTWQLAFAQANAVNADPAQNAGQTDWRLPNENELRSIEERGCTNPSINLHQFPAAPASGFWSGSPYATYPNAAWGVDFLSGGTYWGDRRGAYQVRLVRAGQNFDAAPAAPTITGTPTAVPTLSEWAVLFLICLLGVVGWDRLRQHARCN